MCDIPVDLEREASFRWQDYFDQAVGLADHVESILTDVTLELLTTVLEFVPVKDVLRYKVKLLEIYLQSHGMIRGCQQCSKNPYRSIIFNSIFKCFYMKDSISRYRGAACIADIKTYTIGYKGLRLLFKDHANGASCRE